MELIVIFLLILVLFGPRRLPEIAKMIGKTIHELRKASEDFKDQVMSIESDPDDDSEFVESDYSDLEDQSDMSDYPEHEESDEYNDELAEDVLTDADADSENHEPDVTEENLEDSVV